MSVKVGIVGAERAKFTPEGEAAVKALCAQLLAPPDAVLVSGGCHLGGVDIWAEEAADRLRRPKIIHMPTRQTWSGGYKERNLLIAHDADVLHNIVVANYPETYHGMKFDLCYHCGTDKHIKSGGCWTAKAAQRLGKTAEWHVIYE